MTLLCSVKACNKCGISSLEKSWVAFLSMKEEVKDVLLPHVFPLFCTEGIELERSGESVAS